ncbi:hypothetical protein [Actinocrinis puniceicyclus]|nr:hypothetical protein [Actinocrinis puniceicyclus]
MTAASTVFHRTVFHRTVTAGFVTAGFESFDDYLTTALKELHFP